MKDRPILFSAAMVRALLNGSKTQTRRVLKPVKFYPDFGCAVGRVGGAWKYGSPAALGLRERGDHWSVVLAGDVLQRMCTSEAYGWGAGAGCPYGVPGDRLWVRESGAMHVLLAPDDPLQPMLFRHDVPTTENLGDYWVQRTRAPGASYSTECTREQFLRHSSAKVVPSIHMPRWASRITLEITSVRVERLQDISEADALAEGIVRQPDGGYGLADTTHYHFTDPRQSYFSLWEAINGDGSVDANPWVWAVSFRRLP